VIVTATLHATRSASEARDARALETYDECGTVTGAVLKGMAYGSASFSRPPGERPTESPLVAASMT
jgi:hypothetical protein